MRGVNIKLVRVKSEGEITVRKARDAWVVAKITPIVTCLGYVSGELSTGRESVGVTCCLESTDGTSRREYVLDEVNAIGFFVMTPPRRTLHWRADNWQLIAFFSLDFPARQSDSPSGLVSRITRVGNSRGLSTS